MFKTNYHTHTHFCDGKGAPADYVEAAKEKGFAALGFSGHAPLPYSNNWAMSNESLERYLQEITKLKTENKGNLQIYLGLEIDYIPGKMGPSDAVYDKMQLDYTIGSVHSFLLKKSNYNTEIDYTPNDFEQILQENFAGSVQEMVKEYYRRMADLCLQHKPDILGHFDLIKKNNQNNRFFDETEDWYHEIVLDTLDEIAGTGVIVEINNGGLARKKTTSPYPDFWIIEEMWKRNIPVMVNADAHSPDQIDYNHQGGVELLQKAGYKSVKVLIDSCWKDFPIQQF